MIDNVAPAELVVIGRLGRVFGIKGWIRFHHELGNSWLKMVERGSFWLRDLSTQAWQPVVISEAHEDAKGALLKVAGYDLREEVMTLTNRQLGTLKSSLPRLAKGEYFWSQLKNLAVYNLQGEELGRVADLLGTGANDVLILEGGDRRRLVPYVSQAVLQVDLQQGRMLVDWPSDY